MSRLELTGFWQLLETSFPLGGVRPRLRELLGTELVLALEGLGLLKYRRVADRYPCPRPGGDNCPREVIKRRDGSMVAICGNEQPECADLEVSSTDVEVLAVDPLDLCEAVGKALQVRTHVEELASLRNGYRVGTFIPEASVNHAIYFLVRCGERDCAEAIDALRTQAAGQTLAVLLPTDRFVTDAVRRQAAAAGVVLVPLIDAVGIGATGLGALVDPRDLFAAVGPTRPR